mmetsp:Transcript_57462/g.136628  ORF Transcript_57462/g.136628 Transcript_57462/m.136628 type:complete len:360 (+) Transcript_57462:52-1131(+)
MATRIHVSPLDGSVLSLTARFHWTLQDLKRAIKQRNGLPEDQQRLLSDQVEIVHDADLLELGVLRSGEHHLTLVRRPAVQAEWLRRAISYQPCSRVNPFWEMPESLVSDKGFLFDVVQHRPHPIILEEALRLLVDFHDDDLLRLAVRKNPVSFEYLSQDVRANSRVFGSATIEEVLEVTPEYYSLLSEPLRKDVRLAAKAICAAPNCLQYAPEVIRQNRCIVEKAMQQEPHCLEFAAEEVKSDEELVLHAVKREPSCLRYVPNLGSQKGFVLKAIAASPASLLHADPELQRDADFVLAAVTLRPQALDFAHEELRSSPSWVLAAIKANSECRRFVSKKVLQSESFVLAEGAAPASRGSS